jgi:hypothetical protein
MNSRHHSLVSLLCVGLAIAGTASAQLPGIPPDQQLTGPAPANIERPAAVSGGIALTGYPGQGGDPASSGIVHVYEQVQTGDCTNQPCWAFVQALAPADLAPGNFFGASIAFDGHTALIGSPSSAAGKEAVYVYSKEPQGWILRQKLTSGADTPTNFGRRVALDGAMAAVTSVGYGLPGAAWFFARGSDGSWQLRTKLTPSDVTPDDQFGYSLALDSRTAIVGSNGAGASGNNIGAAYVFRRHGQQWVQEQKLVSSDGGAGSFGQAVDVGVGGNLAVVGAANVDQNVAGLNTQGAAYIFVRVRKRWHEYQKVRPTTDLQWQYFGTSVRIQGLRVGVAARNPIDFTGAVYVFEPSGLKWTDTLKFSHPDQPQSEPQGIASDRRTLIVSTATGIRWLWNLPDRRGPHHNDDN